MNNEQLLREALQELHDVFCEDDHTKSGRHRARLALIKTRAALAQPAEGGDVVEGWKLVPLEPTPDMQRAAIDLEIGDPEDRITMLTFEEARAVYRSMLNAAPPASQEQAQQPHVTRPIGITRNPDNSICLRAPDGSSAVVYPIKGRNNDTWEVLNKLVDAAQQPQEQAQELPDEREAFEAEMRCEDVWGHRSLARNKSGGYSNWCVDLMWGVWQARAALAAKQERKPMTEGCV